MCRTDPLAPISSWRSLTFQIRLSGARYWFFLQLLLFITGWCHIQVGQSRICCLWVHGAVSRIGAAGVGCCCLTGRAGVGGVLSVRVSVYQVPQEVMNKTQTRHLRLEAEWPPQPTNYEKQREREEKNNKTVNRGQRRPLTEGKGV